MPTFPPPQPTQEDIEKTKELYKRKLGREITNAEAGEALASVIQYYWANMHTEIFSNENMEGSVGKLKG